MIQNTKTTIGQLLWRAPTKVTRRGTQNPFLQSHPNSPLALRFQLCPPIQSPFNPRQPARTPPHLPSFLPSSPPLPSLSPFLNSSSALEQHRDPFIYKVHSNAPLPPLFLPPFFSEHLKGEIREEKKEGEGRGKKNRDEKPLYRAFESERTSEPAGSADCT